MNYSVNDDASKTLHGIEKNIWADTGGCPYVFLNSMQGFAGIVVY